jgi:hypothetical protein
MVQDRGEQFPEERDGGKNLGRHLDELLVVDDEKSYIPAPGTFGFGVRR